MSHRKRTPQPEIPPSKQMVVDFQQVLDALTQLALSHKTAGVDVRVYFHAVLQHVVIGVMAGDFTKDEFLRYASDTWDAAEATLHGPPQ
jgi:hypothetical protein